MDFFQLLSEFSDWWQAHKRHAVREGLARWLNQLASATPRPGNFSWNDQRVSQVVGVLHRLQHWKQLVKANRQPAVRAALASWYSLKHRLLNLLAESEPKGLVMRLTRSNRSDAASVSLRHGSGIELWVHWPYDRMSPDVQRKVEARTRR